MMSDALWMVAVLVAFLLGVVYGADRAAVALGEVVKGILDADDKRMTQVLDAVKPTIRTTGGGTSHPPVQMHFGKPNHTETS